MILLKKDVLQAAGSLQLYDGQVAGSEAAIHAMHDIFNDDNMETILVIDAESAFNSINRKVMLHKLKFICPVIATYVSNCYMYPAKLFIIGGGEHYLKRVQQKVIRHRWVLMLSGYYHCFNFCLITFPSTNLTPKRLLLKMT